MLRVACVANSSIVYLLHAVHHPGHGNDAARSCPRSPPHGQRALDPGLATEMKSINQFIFLLACSLHLRLYMLRTCQMTAPESSTTCSLSSTITSTYANGLLLPSSPRRFSLSIYPFLVTGTLLISAECLRLNVLPCPTYRHSHCSWP